MASMLLRLPLAPTQLVKRSTAHHYRHSHSPILRPESLTGALSPQAAKRELVGTLKCRGRLQAALARLKPPPPLADARDENDSPDSVRFDGSKRLWSSRRSARSHALKKSQHAALQQLICQTAPDQ